MKTNTTNKLSAIICVICGLTLLPLTVTAQNAIITTSTIETGTSYHDVGGYSALDIRGNGVVYDGTDITLTATGNTTRIDPPSAPSALAHGAYVTDHATLSLTGGAVSTTGSYGHGILLDNYSTGTLNNVNIDTKGNNSHGVYAFDFSALALTGGTITTGNRYACGISLYNSTGTVRDVNIETKEEYGQGVYTMSSTLTLTGGTITTGAFETYGVYIDYFSTLNMTDTTITVNNNYAHGFYLAYDSTGTLSNVNIKTKGQHGYGMYVIDSCTLTLTESTITTGGNDAFGVCVTDHATLTLTDSTITTDGVNASGINLSYTSSGTVNNVTINTKGESAHGVYVTASSALTLTDSDIITTGNNSNAIYLRVSSTGTANLNKNTLTGNILASGTSNLNLTGSNGTVITGNVTGTRGSTLNITLTGSETKLIGTATHDTTSTITLTIEDEASFIGCGSVTDLTLGDGAILGYVYESLTIDGTLTIGDNILIDFGGVTLEDDAFYTILDWSNAELIGEVTVGQFTATNLNPDIEGTFTVAGNQLTFHATAIPEPSTWFLLGTGLGLLLLTAHYRRRTRS
jgi:hypothetical protein